jgi:hypothetical protein
MKYKIIPEDIIKNLIEFLDEIQFEAASDNDKESMHKINFCNWAIKELLNSYNVMTANDLKKEKNNKGKKPKRKPKRKSRDDYIEETFLDWNLPEMSEEEFEKLVDKFDDFLRSWEDEYNKKNPKKKQIKRESKKFTRNEIIQHMSLEEIKKYLLDDPELTDKERFDLYYTEHERVQVKKNSFTLDEISKKLGIGRYKPPSKNKKN